MNPNHYEMLIELRDKEIKLLKEALAEYKKMVAAKKVTEKISNVLSS